MTQKFRLVTRSDFDGLVCAVLLNELNLIDDIKFVHPKDMQDGKVEITARHHDQPALRCCAHLAFDHHLSETIRNTGERKNHIIEAEAPSAARVVYNYYGGKSNFPTIADDMMDAVDKADSAQFSRDEILNPSGWVLLNYLMDARTGLGRFREFRISNYTLMMDLIKYCRNHNIDEILANCPTSRNGSSSISNMRRRPRNRSSAAPPCTKIWPCLTCVTKKQSGQPTVS
jgi:nanoRNase/pAp phosphatase (c-di-AMP/oligoRNAs hydrolase)